MILSTWIHVLTFPIFLPNLKNEKTVWSRQKNRKQRLSIKEADETAIKF